MTLEREPPRDPFFFDLVSVHRSDLTDVATTPLAQPRLSNAQLS